MTQVFRIYNNLNASIFDLIDGNFEVKQTIALGYLLSNDNIILKKLFHLKPIKRVLGNIKIEQYNKIIVHSELLSSSGKRLDIVIQLYKNDIPDIALIIEAKNISLNISPNKVKNQISSYLNNEDFPLLKEFKLYGCILTKSNAVLDSQNICSISWSQLISILKDSSKLGTDYLNFLSKINGIMNFYEKEVYSIPAGNSYHFQYDYPFIYECPNEGKNFKSMKKPLYFAFRKEKGIMERLFGVEQIIIMNPKQDFNLFMADKTYSTNVKDRVKFYCNSLWGANNYDDNEKQFFILSLNNQIELKHKPRPKKNNSFRAYYKLSELLNSENVIVKTEK